MKVSNLFPKIWQRITRFSFIQKPLLIGSDQFRGVKFLANSNTKKRQYAAFENCTSLENYFGFTEQVFGSHQIKEEILSFLVFAEAEQPQHACEIGTADGGTNFLLSQALPSVSLMIGVDLYVKNRIQLTYFKKTNQQLVFINGSSYALNTVKQVKQALGSKTWIYYS